MSSRLGEILVKDSLITADQLKQALEHQKKSGGRLGTCLVKLGLVNDDDITAVLSRQYGVPSINLKFYEVDPAVIKLVPAGDRSPLSDRPALTRWLDFDHRDDRPHQRLRHGRYKVHDRLQCRAGGGVRDRNQ